MAKKVDVEIDVTVKGQKEVDDMNKTTEEGAEKFKSLRTQIRQTTVDLQAMADAGQEGSDEFKKLANHLDDLQDQQKRVAFQSAQIEDKLAALPGPIGRIGQGFAAAKESVDTFGKGIAASLGIIALIVGAIMLMKDALGKSAEGQKALNAVSDAFGRIMRPIVAFITDVAIPIFNFFADAIDGVGKALGFTNENEIKAEKLLVAHTEAVKKTNEELNNQIKVLEATGKSAHQVAELKKKIIDNELALLDERKKVIGKLTDEELKKYKDFQTEKAVIQTGENKDSLEKTKEFLDNQLKIVQANFDSQAANNSNYWLGQNAKLDKEHAKNLISEEEYNKQKLDLQIAENDQLLAEASIFSVKQQAIYDKMFKAGTIKRAEYDLLTKANQEQFNKVIQSTTNTAVATELKGIEDTKKAKLKAYDDELALLQIRQKKQMAGTTAYFDGLRNIEAVAHKKAMAQLIAGSKEYETELARHAQANIEIDKQEKQARLQLNMMFADQVGQIGALITRAAGKNKDVAIAGIRIQEAATIAKIWMADSSAIREAFEANPIGFGLPWSAYYAADLGIGVAGAIMTANEAIEQINQVPGESSSAGGSPARAPMAAYNGAPSMSAPIVNTTNSANPATQISKTIQDAGGQPIRAYVVSSDITNAQSLERRVNKGATFSLG